MREYLCPEDYPDWDGDESIMYYLDRYEDEFDEEYDEDEVMCECCGNFISVGNSACFTCPECGTYQNI